MTFAAICLLRSLTSACLFALVQKLCFHPIKCLPVQHAPADDDGPWAAKGCEVFQRIGVEENQISSPPRRDGAVLIGKAEEAGRSYGCGLKRLALGQADFDVKIKLVQQREAVEKPGIGEGGVG